MEESKEIEVLVERLGIHGEGVGKVDGYTLFVEGALPGERVRAAIYERRKSFARARVVEFLNRSPDRTEPPCPLFGRCGGCQLMHLSYSKQLEAKRMRVVDALQRIAKIDAEVLPCIASPQTLSYRNKIQLPVSKENRLGLYARNTHDLIEIENCAIHCPLGEKALSSIQRILEKHSELGIKHVLIKTAVHKNEILVILVTSNESILRPVRNCEFEPLISSRDSTIEKGASIEEIQAPFSIVESRGFDALKFAIPDRAQYSITQLAEEIFHTSPEIKGVVQNINPLETNVILGREFRTLIGQGWIEETLGGLYFKVSPASFFQVNPPQAEALYKKALELSELTGRERVLDAYCGVGTLSLFFAQKAKEVIGIESVPEAIVDAKENAQRNGIENTHFICGLAEEKIAELNQIDLALINPPRKGCERPFLEALVVLKPHRIAYISCDPATLARDLQFLSQAGYRVTTVQPFDMFPQTMHVECLVILDACSLRTSNLQS